MYIYELFCKMFFIFYWGTKKVIEHFTNSLLFLTFYEFNSVFNYFSINLSDTSIGI